MPDGAINFGKKTFAIALQNSGLRFDNSAVHACSNSSPNLLDSCCFKGGNKSSSSSSRFNPLLNSGSVHL